MARTTTRGIVIDGREFKIAKLTVGNLRALSEEESGAKGDDFAVLTVQLKAVLTAMKRADPSLELELSQLELITDSEDLAKAHAAVMLLTTGREGPPAGESQSP
jgi:hypothetical protein